MNTRWLEITERVFAIQNRLQTQLSEAAEKLSGKPLRTGMGGFAYLSARPLARKRALELLHGDPQIEVMPEDQR